MAFTFFKTNNHASDLPSRAKQLRDEVNAIEATIRFDWTRRVYGDGVYVGYQTLRDFYKGKQWSFRKDGNGTMRTYNYVFTIVENMTAFLTNEPPQISSTPKRLDDPMERALAEGRTKILNAVHEDNALALTFQRAARTASINGDAFLFGAIPTFKAADDGTKTFDRIRYWNIERPEHIRVIWKDDNFNEIAGFIKHYRISVEMAKRLFKEEIEKSGLVVQADRDMDNITSELQPTEVPMVTVKEYWDEQEYLLTFGSTSNQIAHYMKHDWGFVPLEYIPNIHLPGEPKGTSDIENELDPQQEYNERASDLADVIKELAKPTYWGKNLDNLTEVRSGQTVIYQVGDDGDIQAMPRSGQTFPVEQYLTERKRDIIALSGMNEVLYPGSHVMQATGRALSVIMQGVNNKVSLRKEWWVKALKNINASILFHAEQHVPNAKMLIGGWYKTDVFISSVLLRSVTDEINKFNAKLQSLTTTQHNVGVPNPSEEQKLMKEELQDEILSTEIAKQPALLHQILQARMQAAQEAANAEASGAPAGIASESDNEEGGNPVGTSPVSGEGAVGQAATRRGAPALVRGRR
jgi:hypothetical protein